MPLHDRPFATAFPQEMQGPVGKKDLFGSSPEDDNKHQKLLEWLGIFPMPSNAEFLATCPFHDCPSFIEQKEEKFTMNRKTTQWRCFLCGRTGNKYDLIRQIHAQCLQETTEQQLLGLLQLRKNAMELEDLKEAQIAWNAAKNEWMYPVFSTEGSIANLYLYRQQFDQKTGEKYYQFMSCPSFAHCPIGLQHFRTGTQRKVWILEGQWDYMAWRGLLRRVKLLGENDVLGAPGSGAFPKRWLSLLNSRSVISLYDNDTAGESGASGLLDSCVRNGVLLTKYAKIQWPKELESGFDISDVITKLPSTLWKKK